MYVYHEIASQALDATLAHGLKCTSRGDKGDDVLIIKTDAFLDSVCPERLRRQGLSRDDNLYAYISIDDSIIRITDGKEVLLKDFVAQSSQTVLKVQVEPRYSYISDLDLYDQVKQAVEKGAPEEVLRSRAHEYWHKVVPLADFYRPDITRPEVMITRDVPAQDISVL